ncbi:MAG: L-threonylcarbamoyladenylate synthase [Myxococcota bacterium]
MLEVVLEVVLEVALEVVLDHDCEPETETEHDHDHEIEPEVEVHLPGPPDEILPFPPMPLLPLDAAIFRLLAGEIVAVPTETVYGLAAHATNPDAIRAVFALKGRPPGHPLILHCDGDVDAHAVADDRARALARAFWPGPLTLVLPRRPHVPDALTGGRDTVAVRAPAHPVARRIAAALPFAAPSANRFGHTSPTTAAHVLADFPDLPVVDGGPCEVGLESTIVDLTGPRAALLRPGGVAREAIEAIVGPLGTSDTPAPGTLRAHYAPRARVVPSHDPLGDSARLRADGLRVVVLRAGPDYARTLYAALREADADVVVAEWAPSSGLGEAINDRLRRAAAATGDDDGDP